MTPHPFPATTGRTESRHVRHAIEKVLTMLQSMTRSKAIQIWFATVALIVVAGFAFGTSMTIGTGAMLAALCLVPPAIVLAVWPAAQPQTVAEVLHDAERRR